MRRDEEEWQRPDYVGGLVKAPAFVCWFKDPAKGWSCVGAADTRKEAAALLTARCGQGVIKDRRACVLPMGVGPPSAERKNENARATG